MWSPQPHNLERIWRNGNVLYVCIRVPKKPLLDLRLQPNVCCRSVWEWRSRFLSYLSIAQEIRKAARCNVVIPMTFAVVRITSVYVSHRNTVLPAPPPELLIQQNLTLLLWGPPFEKHYSRMLLESGEACSWIPHTVGITVPIVLQGFSWGWNSLQNRIKSAPRATVQSHSVLCHSAWGYFFWSRKMAITVLNSKAQDESSTGKPTDCSVGGQIGTFGFCTWQVTAADGSVTFPAESASSGTQGRVPCTPQRAAVNNTVNNHSHLYVFRPLTF